MHRICIIGAGFSGICAAIKLKSELSSDFEIHIFDENSDFGGIWLKSTYPGCESDVPSHLYSFSFETNPDWSQAYCSQPEILAYLQSVARKHDLYDYAKFNHKIQELVWIETIQKWKVIVRNVDKKLRSLEVEDIYFDIVVCAQGRFTSPKIPEQFRDFSGPVIHSANWDHNVNVDINGKIVAVIGSGASAAQIVPSIAEKVKRLVVVQRRAPWVIPKKQFYFPPIIKWAFRTIPLIMWIYRSCLRIIFEMRFSEFIIGSMASKIGTRLANSNLAKQIKMDHLREKLTPDYPFGCKSLVLSNEFYATFNRSNVSLLHGQIEKVENDGIIMKDGTKKNIDVIVLATGFQVLNYGFGMTLIGKDGVNVFKEWEKDKPKSYLGIMTSHAPNFFMLLGPNVSTGYTSVVLQLESQVAWIISAIKEIGSLTYNRMCVKPSAEALYMEEITDKMKSTIYSSPECQNSDSSYLNERKDVIEIYPDTVASYAKRTKSVNMKDFDCW